MYKRQSGAWAGPALSGAAENSWTVGRAGTILKKPPQIEDVMWGLCASKRHTARQVSVPTQLRPVDCDLGPEQPKSPATGIGRGGGQDVYKRQVYPVRAFANNATARNELRAAPPPLAIEPRKVSSTANVYAVFAIE